ncbi:Flp pilus assembly protein CpaB [Paenibacillus silviterrae]|uniref:Flp pilus assembly protein CpaB n=1 Tax=Paenibacillus silviterrae TaxID=3242194 RepID=UPI002542CA96|nr:Flp pilus assembly protein CpaB [Paenibacillus chinjuensis]
MRAKLILIVALIMGLATTFLFAKYMKRFDMVSEANVTLIEVVSVKQPVKENTQLNSSMLQVVQVPKMGVHPQTVMTLAEAEGKIAAADLHQGEVLLSGHIRDTKAEALRVARKVQEGYRAVSVGVNFVQTVSNLIEPEDLVDVILSTTDKNTNVVTTMLLLEKVRVLAIGRRMVEADKDTPYAEYSSVTLELKPQEAVTLVNADERGNISLAIHTKVNAPAPPTPGAAAPAPAPAK